MTDQTTPETSDAELVRCAKAGDPDAFEALTGRYEQRVYGLAISVPVVIAYTVCIYWIFRGRVKLDRMSY